MRGDLDAAREYGRKASLLTDNAGVKLLAGGMRGPQLDAAMQASVAPEGERGIVFTKSLQGALDALPWAQVEQAVRIWKASREINSRNVCIGTLMAKDGPSQQAGAISTEVARTIVRCRRDSVYGLAYKAQTIALLRDYIHAHEVRKPSIWAARDVSLQGRRGLRPVVIAIWDTGVDAKVYPSAMWTNLREAANGKDDDGNGYVDDIHGLQFGMLGQGIRPGTLPQLGEMAGDWEAGRQLLKGSADVIASIDSREAEQYRARQAQLLPEEFAAFGERQSFFGNYVHGTHVAGIAAAGNPAARLLSIGSLYPWKTIPEPITEDVAVAWVAFARRSVDYMRAHGVRVANMSWGWLPTDIEQNFELNNIGADPDARARMARKSFDIMKQGLGQAMRSAPEILFVEAAGNTGTDIEFTEDIPATLGLDNLLVVGAADHAGDETTYSAKGKLVDVYASGYQVTSRVPGGQTIALSGASMAAPQVVNLAGKLLALDPALDVAALKRLIRAGTDMSADGRLRLLNPRRSIELLRQASP